MSAAWSWVRRYWWVLLGGLLAVVVAVLYVVGQQRMADSLRAAVGAAMAKAKLQHLATVTDVTDAKLARIQAERDAAEAAHRDAAKRLGRELVRTKGMTDAEVDAELTRRGHR
jgi:hypothetical protein